MFRLIGFLILATAVAINAMVKLPENIPTCDAKSPTVNECLKTAIIIALHELKNGKKSLGLLPLDPLSVDEIVLDIGTAQAPFLFTGRNVKVYGLTQSIAKDVEFDPERMTMTFHSLTPNATFVFDYEANGRILVLPVNGAGPGSFTFHDMDATQSFEGVPVTKKYDVTKYDIKFDAKKLDINLEGLFKGNKQISDQLTDFLHKEWRVFLDQLRGPSAEAFGAIFKDLAIRVFSRVPYGEAFPGAMERIKRRTRSRSVPIPSNAFAIAQFWRR